MDLIAILVCRQKRALFFNANRSVILMVRTFIAVSLVTEELSSIVTEFQEELRKLGGRMTFPRTEQLHLTLHFFGDISNPDAERVCSIMDSLRITPSVHLSILGLVLFPNALKPRVIALGVDDGREQIVELAKRTRKLLRENGFHVESRRFKPHITVARVKQLENPQTLQDVLSAYSDRVAAQVEITDIRLLKSVLTPEGPVYSIIHKVALNGD